MPKSLLFIGMAMIVALAFSIKVSSAFIVLAPSATQSTTLTSMQSKFYTSYKIQTTQSPHSPFFLSKSKTIPGITTTIITKTTNIKLFESKIPNEFKNEIYEAEAKTPAAQGRQTRIIGYGLAAFIFFSLALANVIFTSMLNTGEDLEAKGYGWSQSFFLLNTTGGGWVDVIMTGLLGTMVDLENRKKDETAEEIWVELQLRKEEFQKKKRRKEAQKMPGSTSKGGKKSSSKQAKRLAALAEVIVEDKVKEEEAQPEIAPKDEEASAEVEPENKSGTGIMGKLKDFYKQADTMAASQALLLNKKLEDEGIVEKITDETGLKVIGKEAAAKAKKETPPPSKE